VCGLFFYFNFLLFFLSSSPPFSPFPLFCFFFFLREITSPTGGYHPIVFAARNCAFPILSRQSVTVHLYKALCLPLPDLSPPLLLLKISDAGQAPFSHLLFRSCPAPGNPPYSRPTGLFVVTQLSPLPHPIVRLRWLGPLEFVVGKV